MKLFNCNTRQATITMVDLPRTAYRHLPPKKWQVALAVVSIFVSSVLFAVT